VDRYQLLSWIRALPARGLGELNLPNDYCPTITSFSLSLITRHTREGLAYSSTNHQPPHRQGALLQETPATFVLQTHRTIFEAQKPNLVRRKQKLRCGHVLMPGQDSNFQTSFLFDNANSMLDQNCKFNDANSIIDQNCRSPVTTMTTILLFLLRLLLLLLLYRDAHQTRPSTNLANRLRRCATAEAGMLPWGLRKAGGAHGTRPGFLAGIRCAPALTPHSQFLARRWKRKGPYTGLQHRWSQGGRFQQILSESIG
jgi:hypothetical protein